MDLVSLPTQSPSTQDKRADHGRDKGRPGLVYHRCVPLENFDMNCDTMSADSSWFASSRVFGRSHMHYDNA